MTDILQSICCCEEHEDQQPHFHDYNLAVYIADGVAELTVEGSNYILSAGDLALISRYERHSFRIRSPHCRRYLLKFAPTIQQGEFAMLVNRPAGFQHTVNLSESQFIVRYIIRRLLFEQEQKLPDSREMQEHLLGELRILVSRNMNSSCCRRSEFALIFQVQQLFEQDCTKDYRLEDLAKQFCVSVSTLSHQFKKVTGFSVFDYLTERRLALARTRLVSTNDSISRIAADCGFGFSSNFSKIFRAHSGMTPSQYRSESRLAK